MLPTLILTPMDRMGVTTAFRLMQLCDSALPVGGFSFSCALESAVEQGVVSDVVTLEEYAATVVKQTLRSDGVAALHAFRNADRMDELLRADELLYARKVAHEWRTMSCRMGRKLAELGTGLLPEGMMSRWLKEIASAHTAGCNAISQGLLFSLCGADEEALFAATGYGAAVMITGAALRLMRVSHHDAQRILFALGQRVETEFREVKNWNIEDMQGFAPQLDVLSSLHERGRQRMFMS